MQKWTRALYQPNLPLYGGKERVTASKEHIALSKDVAAEGMVLLKNENQVLPLSRGSKVALFGKGTFDYVKGGGGSGDVTVPYIRNLYEGLSMMEGEVEIFEDSVQYYKQEVENQYKNGRVPGMVAEPEVPEELLLKAAAYTDTAIISISRFSGEAWDRSCSFDEIEEHVGVFKPLIDQVSGLFEDGDFYLSRAEKAMVEKVSASFAKVIVVLNVGGMVDSSWFCSDPSISSVLLAWQGGMEGGLAAAELLLGKKTPSGHLSDTFAKRLEDYPSSSVFHKSDDYIEYNEDIYVGYRYFETIPGAKEKVNYPFGYGLSYTTFCLEELQVFEENGKIEVSVNVLNTGSYPGKEVVQVYFGAPQGVLGKPARELAAYKKTRLLEPGQSQIVRISFPIFQMASYDDLGKVQHSAWLLEKGEYHFYVGSNVRDAKEASFVFEISENVIVSQTKERLAPTMLKERMLCDGSYETLPQRTPVDTDANILTPISSENLTDAMEGVMPQVRHQASYIMGMKPEVPQLMDVYEGRLSVKEFLAAMSDEDLAWLLGGQPNTGCANTMGYGNQPKFGIPNIMTADGPAGLRIAPEVGVQTTAFPCATLLACTWNPELVEQVGIAGGEEVKENNISVWLTPAVNIHRSPLCGRNFEYYSEDPYLTGRQAAAMVRGIQSNHVAATVKHFALNNKETNRKDSDSRVSERAAREIYLKAFELIVKEASPWSIMTSYNIINGVRASENADLLNGILREEWGFDGMVTTDWWTHGENYKEVAAGNDMKMGCGYPDRLLEALHKGGITREEMEKAGENVLKLILRVD